MIRTASRLVLIALELTLLVPYLVLDALMSLLSSGVREPEKPFDELEELDELDLPYEKT